MMFIKSEQPIYPFQPGQENKIIIIKVYYKNQIR